MINHNNLNSFVKSFEEMKHHSIIKYFPFASPAKKMIMRITCIHWPNGFNNEGILHICDVEREPPCKYENNPFGWIAVGAWIEEEKRLFRDLLSEFGASEYGEWTKEDGGIHDIIS